MYFDALVALVVTFNVNITLQSNVVNCCLETIPTADEKEAFSDIDAAILVGAFPRKQGMERKDLLQANAKIFESQGKSLDQYAKKSVKVQKLHSYTRFS